MKRKTTELILLESGRYMLDMSKLVFGGVVLVVILQIESLSNVVLLITGLLATVLTATFGMYLTSISQTNKKKGE
jgi:hypothetical protein